MMHLEKLIHDMLCSFRAFQQEMIAPLVLCLAESRCKNTLDAGVCDSYCWLNYPPTTSNTTIRQTSFWCRSLKGLLGIDTKMHEKCIPVVLAVMSLRQKCKDQIFVIQIDDHVICWIINLVDGSGRPMPGACTFLKLNSKVMYQAHVKHRPAGPLLLFRLMGKTQPKGTVGYPFIWSCARGEPKARNVTSKSASC